MTPLFFTTPLRTPTPVFSIVKTLGLLCLCVLLCSAATAQKRDSDSVKISRYDNELREIKYLKEDISRLQERVKDADEKIKSYEGIFDNMQPVLGFIAIVVALLTGYFITLFQGVKKKVDDRIAEAIRQESENLYKIYEGVKKEVEIYKKKILVFTSYGVPDDNLKHLLRSNNFRSIEFQKFDTNINAASYDLIIFFELEDIKSIESFIKNSSSDVKYFYFGSKFFDDGLAKSFKYHVSSSKFPSQIIGNIMNLLKYN